MSISFRIPHHACNSSINSQLTWESCDWLRSYMRCCSQLYCTSGFIDYHKLWMRSERYTVIEKQYRHAEVGMRERLNSDKAYRRGWKKCSHSIHDQDIATISIRVCSVYRAPSNKPNITLLACKISQVCPCEHVVYSWAGLQISSRINNILK